MFADKGKGNLLRHIVKFVEEELSTLGMTKKKSVYVLSLADDVFGLVGLNVALRRGDRTVGINPVVGVRYAPLEQMLENLLATKESRLTATLSSALGYLTPQKRYLEWLFETAPFDYVSECKGMVEAINTYGFGFMRANATLDAVLNRLKELQFTSKEEAAYRLPIAYFLAGQKELAIKHLKGCLAELGDRSDVAAQQYKLFSSNLLRKCGAEFVD